MLAIELDGVSKRFRLRMIAPATTLKTAVVDRVLGRRQERREPAFQALRDITFAIRRGQTFGVIGRNGSGKSTLLKLMAGIYRPDAGRIQVHGRVAGLLELGAGFHPEFSGRENIFINGIVLGLSKGEVRRRFNDIVRFAELDAFIDEPVRTYSSGMYMRLGFAVAVHTDPDILLIDEILAVGDEPFQKKCYEKIGEFQREGKTMVLVSHDLPAVARWCDEAAWLDGGTVREQGEPGKVIEQYRLAVSGLIGEPELTDGELAQEFQAPTPAPMSQEEVASPPSGLDSRRWGTGEIELTSVRLLDQDGQPRTCFQSGEPASVEIRYRVHQPCDDVIFGIAVVREDGIWCYGTNTDIESISLPPLGREGVVEVTLENLGLLEGHYYLDVAVHPQTGAHYDYHSRLHPFSVSSKVKDIGIFRIPHRWTFGRQE